MKHLSDEIPSFHPRLAGGYACILGTRFHPFLLPAFSISSSLAGERRPLSFTAYHFQPSLSLSLSSHFSSSSFSQELNRGVASHLRRKKEREGGRERKSHLGAIFLFSSLLLACPAGRRLTGAASLSWTATVSAEREGGEGTGKMIKASSSSSSPVGWLLSLSLSLSPPLSDSRGREGEGRKTKVKARGDGEKCLTPPSGDLRIRRLFKSNIVSRSAQSDKLS